MLPRQTLLNYENVSNTQSFRSADNATSIARMRISK